jgi:hypothetical protein
VKVAKLSPGAGLEILPLSVLETKKDRLKRIILESYAQQSFQAFQAELQSVKFFKGWLETADAQVIAQFALFRATPTPTRSCPPSPTIERPSTTTAVGGDAGGGEKPPQSCV